MADIDIRIRVQAARARAQLEKFNAQVERSRLGVEKAQLQNQILQQRLARLADQANKSSRGLFNLNTAFSSFVGNLGARAVESAFSLVIRGLRGAVEASIEFEAGLVSVGKTTGLTGSALEDLGRRITNISRELPTSTNELLQLATVAGQLGINSAQEVEVFTETLAKLNLATDIVGEEGAQSVARILDITNELGAEGPQNIEKFGSVITELGNNFAATESQILDTANEIAKGTAAFNVSSEDVLGLATAFRATGSQAEVSGSVIQRVLVNIGKAVETGGSDLQAFADAANISTAELQNVFREDPTAAFLKLAEGLNASGQSGAELAVTLERLGFADVRVVRTLAPLISRYDTLSRSIRTAREEAQEQTALNQEVERQLDTLESSLTLLSNAFEELGRSFVDDFNPALKLVVDGLTSVIQVASDNIDVFTNLGFALISPSTAASNLGKELANLALQSGDGNQNVAELDKGIQQLDSTSRTFLTSLTGLTEDTENLVEVIKEEQQTYVELNDIVSQTPGVARNAARQILAFESEKLAALKEFYKEDEVAQIEANFAKLKSEQERQEFLKLFAREGANRQRQEFLRTIGLDNQTIESARRRQEELKKLKDQEIEAERLLNEAKVAEMINESENFQFFNQGRLEQLREFFTQEEEVKAEARLLTIENDRLREVEITKLVTEGLQRRLEAQIEFQRNRANAEKDANRIIAEDNKELARLEEQRNRTRLSNTRSTLGSISTLQQSSSRELAAIGKAAAIANVTINTAEGVSKAWALGPILGPILAPLVVAAGALQAQKIASAQPRFQNGGIVGGTSFSGDQVQARVNSGEMILNRQQQAQLFDLANGSAQAASQPQEIVVNTTVELDGEAVATSVSRQVANGFVLGEVQ